MRSSAESGGPGFHVENRSEPARHAFRPGRKLDSEGPVAKAVRNAGLKSRDELARRLGYTGEAVRSWDRRKKAPAAVMEALAAPPYSVPLTDWVG